MPKSVKEAAAAAMDEAARGPSLKGGQLDLVTAEETSQSVQRQDPQVTVGRWYIKGNTGTYDQWFSLAKEQKTDHAERPATGIVAHRNVDGVNYLLLRPCKNGETGVKVTYPVKNPNTFMISKLHLFLQRNKLVPAASTVFNGPCKLGNDSDLGPCIIMNVTDAKLRKIEKKPAKAKKDAAKAAAPAPETKAEGQQ